MQDTGIIIPIEGASFRVTVKGGEWSHGPITLYDGRGTGENHSDTISNSSLGTLLARVGSRKVLEIGNDATIRSNQEGELQFVMNDYSDPNFEYHKDNRGVLIVEVEFVDIVATVIVLKPEFRVDEKAREQLEQNRRDEPTHIEERSNILKSLDSFDSFCPNKDWGDHTHGQDISFVTSDIWPGGVELFNAFEDLCLVLVELRIYPPDELQNPFLTMAAAGGKEGPNEDVFMLPWTIEEIMREDFLKDYIAPFIAPLDPKYLYHPNIQSQVAFYDGVPYGLYTRSDPPYILVIVRNSTGMATAMALALFLTSR